MGAPDPRLRPEADDRFALSLHSTPTTSAASTALRFLHRLTLPPRQLPRSLPTSLPETHLHHFHNKQDVRYLQPIVSEVEAENTERAFWDNVVVDKSKKH